MARPATTYWENASAEDPVANAHPPLHPGLNTREGVILDYVDERAQQVEINTQSGTAYTLVLTDAGKVVEMNNASSNTVTVPQNSSVAFPVGTVITVRQVGAGATSVAQGTGTTLRPSSPQSVPGQWTSRMLHKRATNEWVVE
jgi:hypothetical protein